MNLESKISGDFICIKPLSQRIDATACSEFKEKIIHLINQGNNFLLLNLSQVEFVDSSGLGAMIFILKTLKETKGQIVICELNHAVKNLFTLTRMNNVFTVRPNEKEGLECLKGIKEDIRGKLAV